MIARRAAVLVVLAICALLVSPLPLHGLGPAAALALAALDVVLLAGTGGLAFARARSLDERQAALRDLAYRRGFRLLGLGIVVALIGTAAGDWVVWHAHVTSGGAGAISQVDSGLSGRLVVAIAELVVVLPTLVVAWSTPDRGGRAGTLRLALAVPALAAVWLLGLAGTPEQAAATSRNFAVDTSVVDSTCRHFVSGRIVGGGFGATVGMRVEVCWNGRTAFVAGDPGIPPPPGAVADPGDPGSSFLTACGVDNLDDFAAVSGTTCTATVDAQGTLHYRVRAHVSPLPVPVGGRDVIMELVVTRDGRVLSQP